MAPEIGLKSLGTFEKRTPANNYSTERPVKLLKFLVGPSLQDL